MCGSHVACKNLGIGICPSFCPKERCFPLFLSSLKTSAASSIRGKHPQLRAASFLEFLTKLERRNIVSPSFFLFSFAAASLHLRYGGNIRNSGLGLSHPALPVLLALPPVSIALASLVDLWKISEAKIEIWGPVWGPYGSIGGTRGVCLPEGEKKASINNNAFLIDL